MNPKLAKGAAAVGAVAVLVFGAAAISGADSSSSSSSSQQNGPGRGFGGPPGTNGQPGRPPGMGTDVTGTTADKVAQAATAKYAGQIEHIEKLPDGSYVAHVITSKGEVHVHVSSAFKVLGTEDLGGRGGDFQPPGGGQAPTAPSTSSSSGKTI